MIKKAPQRSDSASDRLLRAGVRLFSKYGYDATTTRMIAKEAQVNLSAISFHFVNKEALYKECLNFIAAKTEQYYKKSFREAQELLSCPSAQSSEANAIIEKLIGLQISAAFEWKYRSSLNLIYWEQISSIADYHPVSDMVFEKVERTIAQLMCIAQPTVNYKKAIIASRFINGSIIAFGEHSLLVGRSMEEIGVSGDLKPWMRGQITKYCDLLVRECLEGE